MKKTDRAAFFTLTFTLHRFKRLSAMFLLGVLCLSLAAGCGGEEAAPGLTLGVIADLAGQKEGGEPEAALSEDLAFYYGVQHAVNGAIAENAAGLRFRLLTGDLAGDPGSVWDAYTSLVEEGADAILCLSKYAEEIADDAARRKILLMVPDEGGMLAPVSYGEDGSLLSADPGTVAGHEGFFSLRPDPVYYGRAAAFLMRACSYRTAAIAVNREDGYFLAAADAFAEAAEEYGIRVTARESFSPGDAESVKEAAEKLRQAGGANAQGQGYFIACAFSQVAESVGNALWQGGLYSGTPVFYADGSDYEPYIDGDGGTSGGKTESTQNFPRYFLRQSLCLGVYNRHIKKIKRSEAAKSFCELYGSELTAPAFWGWEGASALLRAAEALGDGKRALLWENGLQGNSFVGMSGSEFCFTEEGYAERSLSVVKFTENEEGELTDTLRIEGFRPKEMGAQGGDAESGK